MTTAEKIKYWISLSDKDLIVSKDMFEKRHYLYAGFLCHLSIEKILKAVYTKLKEETAPRIHDLPLLAVKGEFYEKFSEEQKMFLNSLNPLNIEARYPEYKSMLSKSLNKKKCVELIENTKILQQWIKKKLL